MQCILLLSEIKRLLSVRHLCYSQKLHKQKYFPAFTAPNMPYSKVTIQHTCLRLCEVSALANHEMTLDGCEQKLNDKKQVQEEVLQIQQSTKLSLPLHCGGCIRTIPEYCECIWAPAASPLLCCFKAYVQAGFWKFCGREKCCVTDRHGLFSTRGDKGNWKSHLVSDFVVMMSASQFVML